MRFRRWLAGFLTILLMGAVIWDYEKEVLASELPEISVPSDHSEVQDTDPVEETGEVEEQEENREEETAEGETEGTVDFEERQSNDSNGGATAHADNIAEGQCGDIAWVIDADRKLILSGTGELSRSGDGRPMPWALGYGDSISSAEVHVTGMTDASGMFAECRSMMSVDLSDFDTSSVTNMSDMFSGCRNLGSLDLSTFNTENVTNMSYMFTSCLRLASVDVSSFNTVNVTDMSGMFWSCSNMENLDISSFDTRNVTNMSYMFGECSDLGSLDLSSFDTGNVTNMSRMFMNDRGLGNLNVSSFDTGSVINMEYMFWNCPKLTSLDVSSFDTGNVTGMNCMFGHCASLTSLDLSNFNTVSVISMADMFYCCENLTNLDVSSFNTSNVINMGGMFGECHNLMSLDLSSFNIGNVTYMDNILVECSKLTEINAPYNVLSSITLPPDPDNAARWFLPDGTEITELPQGLDHSVLLVRRINPRIITTTTDLNMDDVVRVKYVPYSCTVKTDNWEEENVVTFSLIEGRLAEGLQMYSATGEIYGVPLESGTFPIKVKASYSNPEFLPSYAELVLTVIENTDSNVSSVSDPGYEIEQYVGTQRSGTEGFYYVITENTDQLFVSSGDYSEFIDLWLNGKRLAEGRDYTKESGSTRITVRSQTFTELADQEGIHTIAAEFRVGGDLNRDLKRTAQNFRVEISKENGVGGENQDSASDEGNQDTASEEERKSRRTSAEHSETEIRHTITTVVRLVDTAGTPLTGAILELHSTPQKTHTDRNGTAVFAGVESGIHTLYAKDGNGNILASKTFELLFGEKASINAEQVTVKAGAAFTLQVQMKENELVFLSVQDGDIYQVVSADTGDDMEPELWLALLLVSCSLSWGIYAGYRKRKTY